MKKPGEKEERTKEYAGIVRSNFLIAHSRIRVTGCISLGRFWIRFREAFGMILGLLPGSWGGLGSVLAGVWDYFGRFLGRC